MFTNRFYKVRAVSIDEEGCGNIGYLNIKPFSIVSYCESQVEFVDDSGAQVSYPAVIIETANNNHILLIDISTFEEEMNKFFG